MFGYGCSNMSVLGWLVMIGFWGGVLAVAVWAMGRLFPASRSEQPSATEILDRRFAAGEIDEKAYRRARDEVTSGVP
jgi:putative membrane protein